MSTQPEDTRHKYTDRDVREDATLISSVEEFLRAYQGDFQYLRDAKYELVHHDNLTIGVARGVLNCMRAGPRWAGRIHEPKGYSPSENRAKSNVTYIGHLGTPIKKQINQQCIRTMSHARHAWTESEQLYNCDGIPWEINRKHVVVTDATIKYPVVLARSGTKIHKATGVGKVDWYVPQHEYGYGFCTLYVKVGCRMVGWLKEPLLLEEIPDLNAISQLREITLCSHCWDS